MTRDGSSATLVPMLPHPFTARPRRRFVALTALVAVTLAACSDDDPAATATTPAPVTTAAPSTTSIATTTTPTTTAPAPVTSAPATSAPDTVAVVGDDPAAATRAAFASVGPDDPGCSVAVGVGGEVVFAEAYGAARLDPTEPMTIDTVVDIGSTSKQFTATAILLLEDDGLVALDEPVATYLPDLPPWAAKPTVRQLMHHVSGIPDYIDLLTDAGFELTGSSTDADALTALGEVTELDFEPGVTWAYSNSNYFLLGQIVLAVTGSTLDEFLAAEVFEPLGLDMVMDPTAALPGKAVSYEGTGTAITVADSRWEQLGDGGIQTTPTQLVRWASEYWAPTFGGDQILDRRLVDSAGITDQGAELGRYGAGIQVLEDGEQTFLSHSGGWGGFVTLFVVQPDEQIVVAATCTSPDTAIGLGLESELDLIRPWLA